jgi:hypothetical protein
VTVVSLVSSFLMFKESVCPFVRIGSPSAVPALLEPRGRQHSLAGEGVGKPIRTNGKKAWHSVYSVVSAVQYFA